ncbi:hypothetical protein C4M95_05125, partial [Mycoplasmopsis pullorum]
WIFKSKELKNSNNNIQKTKIDILIKRYLVSLKFFCKKYPPIIRNNKPNIKKKLGSILCINNELFFIINNYKLLFLIFTFYQ